MLLNLFCFVHPCHLLPHSHSPYYEYMADVPTIIVHRMFIVKPRYLFYLIHSMLSAMQRIGYDLQTGFITDSASRIVLFVSSALALFENKKGQETFYQ